MDAIENSWKTTKYIHLAICAFLALVIGVIYVVLKPGLNPKDDATSMMLELIVPLIAVISIASGHFFYKRIIKRSKNLKLPLARLEQYRVASLVRWAAVEGSAFLAILSFVFTGRNNMLLYALMLGVLLIYLRPLRTRIITELGDEFSDLK